MIKFKFDVRMVEPVLRTGIGTDTLGPIVILVLKWDSPTKRDGRNQSKMNDRERSDDGHCLIFFVHKDRES